MFLLATIIILSYLVGSIPTSIIISKLSHGIDIREHGSGNAGGTNVMRVLGWKKGLLVILLDALKGAFAVVVVARLHYGGLPFQNVSPFDDFTLVQIIVAIIQVEHQRALGGGEAAKVGKMRVPRRLHGQTAHWACGQITGHHRGRSTIKGEGRGEHPLVAHWQQFWQTSLILCPQERDGVRPAVWGRPLPVRGTRNLLP